MHVEISTIDSITAWFKTIKPKPANKSVQFGAMCEEFGEILRACGIRDERLEQIRDKFYHAKRPPFERTIDDVELLDAICDTIVTLVGFGYMMGYDVHGALNEVNASNWSKFENGEPVFNEHGKIAKGENYRPPELEKFV
ncbi:hypothetical protein B0181_02205 [Moraxella caviae]|uniref:Phosphoribosyl-ATP pyrophosphohydrolase n=1 Tax=Moraxella caviae TaxID=34060 RepID=A0A1T0A916_9GAMM|nr:hypothetical protein B0181_02205 [Moraxella caviae]